MLLATLLQSGLVASLLAGAAPQPSDTAWKDPSLHTVRRIAVSARVQLEVLDWGGTGPALIFLAGFGNSAHVFDNFAPEFVLISGLWESPAAASGHPTSPPRAGARHYVFLTHPGEVRHEMLDFLLDGFGRWR